MHEYDGAIDNIIDLFDQDGLNPLMYAASKQCLRSVEALIQFFKESENDYELDITLHEWINMPGSNDQGFTALHYAAFHGQVKIMKLLI